MYQCGWYWGKTVSLLSEAVCKVVWFFYYRLHHLSLLLWIRKMKPLVCIINKTIMTHTIIMHTWKIVWTLLFSAFFVSTTVAQSNSHQLLDYSNGSNNFLVMNIPLDWSYKIVVPVVDNYQQPQSLQILMQQVWWVSAINGWYFCPDEAAYTRCEGNTTDWLRKSQGQLFSKRWEDIAPQRAVFGFSQAMKPQRVTNETRWRSNEENTRDNPMLDEIDNGLMMPALVENGQNVAQYNDEMNNDTKQWSKGTKMFICTTRNEKNVYMWSVSNVTFTELADVIKNEFDCSYAIQLDSWGTRAIMYEWKHVAWPWRNMMDAFVIVPITSREKQQEQNQNQENNYHETGKKIVGMIEKRVCGMELSYKQTLVLYERIWQKLDAFSSQNLDRKTRIIMSTLRDEIWSKYDDLLSDRSDRC